MIAECRLSSPKAKAKVRVRVRHGASRTQEHIVKLHGRKMIVKWSQNDR